MPSSTPASFASAALTLFVLAACGRPEAARSGGVSTPPPEPLATAGVGARADSAPLNRIAFGSCNRQDLPQPLWAAILATAPQLWIWTGDNVYGDTRDTAVLRAKYDLQLRQPDYRAFAARVPVIGTWDDHDYGVNDGGKEYPERAESQQLALDFLGEPADGVRRRRAGMYEAYTYGPPGQQVKILLLDTRYFRDPLPPRGETSDGDVLGDVQWRWLEGELRGSTAAVHLIVSSIQVIPEDHRFEKWANFPRSRERLLRLVRDSRAPGVVFLSGDRHIAELSRLDSAVVGYPVYELTSSGLTHTWSEARGETNRHRVGPLVVALNFGTVDVDWSRRPARLTLRVRGEGGRVHLEETIAAGQPAGGE